jgi:NodT family efflux transporter outer membrane factor (OMF) lipoprotein
LFSKQFFPFLMLLLIATFVGVPSVEANIKLPWSFQPKIDKNTASQEAWVGLPAINGVTANTPLDLKPQYPYQRWWEALGDTHLNALVDEALAQNLTLKTFEARVNEAKGAAKVLGAGRFPSVSLGPSYSLQKFSQNQFPFNPNSGGGIGGFGQQGKVFHNYNLPIKASYEVDFWGRNQDVAKQGKLGIATAQADLENLSLQLSAQVVSAYINLLKSDALILKQQDLSSTFKRSLELEQSRFNAGLDALDPVELRQRDLADSEALQAGYEAIRSVALSELAVLLGKTPASVQTLERGQLNNLSLSASIDAGEPQTLLTHRPDIKMAELALQRSAISVAIARKAFMPQVTLSGSSGFVSLYAQKWLRWASLANNAAASVNIPLFTGGALKGDLMVSKAQLEQQLKTYQLSILTAYSEVEKNLANLQADQFILERVQQQEQSFTNREQLQKTRWKAGLLSEADWLPWKAQVLQQQQAVLLQKADLLTDRVSLNMALGGGFTY